MTRKSVSFLVSTFLFSWILWLPSVLEYFGVITFNSEVTSNAFYFITIILGAFGPTFGTFIALRKTDVSFKAHLRRIFSKKGITQWGRYLLLILLLPLAINGFSLLVGMIFQLPIPASPLPNEPWFLPYLLYVPYIIFVSVLGGGQEEIGWRGYLQGELLKTYDRKLVSLIIGFFWGLWHTPLWFMIWDGHTFTPYVGFILMTMSISFVYSYLYEKSQGNMLLLILFHGCNNAAHALFYVFYDDKPAAGQSLYWVYVLMNVIAAVIVILLWKRTSNRQKNES